MADISIDDIKELMAACRENGVCLLQVGDVKINMFAPGTQGGIALQGGLSFDGGEEDEPQDPPPPGVDSDLSFDNKDLYG